MVSMLNVLTTAGWVSTKVEMKTSKGGMSYTGFDISVQQGYGDDQTNIFYECIAFGQLAERIVNAKVKKGSHIAVTGEFSMKQITRKDGTIGSKNKIKLYDWSYMPTGKETQE